MNLLALFYRQIFKLTGGMNKACLKTLSSKFQLWQNQFYHTDVGVGTLENVVGFIA